MPGSSQPLPGEDIAGVRYLNAGAAQTSGEIVAVIRSVPGPKMIYVTGATGDADHQKLARIIEDFEVVHTFIAGESELATSLSSIGYDHYSSQVQDARGFVQACFAIAEPGDSVISFVAEGFDEAVQAVREAIRASD